MTIAPLALILVVFVIPGIVILRQKRNKVRRGLLYYYKLVRPYCHEQKSAKCILLAFLGPPSR